MMQQNDKFHEWQILDDDVVISIYDESAYVEEGILAFIDHAGIIYRYKLICDANIIIKRHPNILHYLNRFWILLPSALNEQMTLWQEFYKLYSHMYNQLINSQHNILCLSYFKQLLEKNFFPIEKYRILDFGCGAGLSTAVFDCERLIGYDNNEVMLNKSQKRGLITINTSQFRNLPSECFDGCFACYVLHLAISTNDINQLIRLIKVNGIIVANFYKGMHEVRINKIIQKNGLVIEQIDTREGRFGSIYVYRKK